MWNCEMLELGRPGCVFTFPGMILGANTALPTCDGVYWNVQGVAGDSIQPFMDLFSLKFQPSNLPGSQKAIPGRCRWKSLQQDIGMSCFWGSRVSRHPSGVLAGHHTPAQQCQAHLFSHPPFQIH